MDDAGPARRTSVLERVGARVTREAEGAHSADGGVRLPAEQALCEVEGFEIAMMTCTMLGAARAGRIVPADGFVAGAAAVAALDMDASVRADLVFGHRSAEAGHARVLETSGADPLLDLGMRLGEGTGALLAVPLVRAAAAALTDTADLESVGIEPA